MKNLRFSDYSWVVKGFTAIVLLAAFVYMSYIQFTNEEVAQSVLTPLIGITILLFTIVRIFPVLRSRSEKDYLLVMYSEILISLVIGVLFIALPEFAYNYFHILLGVVLYIRGCVYFFTTTKRYELSDAISFVVNILFISFGFAFIFFMEFTPNSLMYVLIALALIFSVYYGYGTYTGFNNTHLNRQNRLKMQDILNKKEEEDDNVIKDPKHIEEKRNPKIIDEPKETDITPTIEDERESDIVS